MGRCPLLFTTPLALDRPIPPGQRRVLLAQAPLNFGPRDCPVCSADYVRRHGQIQLQARRRWLCRDAAVDRPCLRRCPQSVGWTVRWNAPDTPTTLSFAVPEVVLGVGGLLAVKGADTSPAVVRAWAGLGALTDAGDLAA